MPKVVTPAEFPNALQDILERFDAKGYESGNKVMREVVTNMFGSVIEETPVGDFDGDHEGTLKGEWQITRGNPAEGLTGRRAPKRTRSSIKLGRHVLTDGKSRRAAKWYLTNNLPYAEVVEYGGYPKAVKFGTFNKKTGQYQIRSAGGYSKQAPRGMVRRNVNRFGRFLEVAANKVL